jgi:hypothetical protein
MTRRRIALLLELPTDDQDEGMRGLRWLLKRLLRGYGIRCLALRPPDQTATFGPKRETPSNPTIEEKR